MDMMRKIGKCFLIFEVYFLAVNCLQNKPIDLTHEVKTGFVYFPNGQQGFSHRILGSGPTSVLDWVAIGEFSSGEHVGTHMDAPYHFHKTGWKLSEIPVDRMFNLPVVIIDVQEKVKQNTSYAVSEVDVTDWEALHGPVPATSVVFMCSGWDKYIDDHNRFLGSNSKDPDNFRFPSFGESAAKYLIDKRRIYGLAVDTLSIDIGGSRNTPVHVYSSANNVFGLELVKGACSLPAFGTKVNVFPMKISGATGGPARIIVTSNKATRFSRKFSVSLLTLPILAGLMV